MVAVEVAGQAALLLGDSRHWRIVTGRAESCAANHPEALRLTLARLHWLTSGATSLARGLNDAPKMVALVTPLYAVVGEGSLSTPTLFGIVAVAMFAGSLAAGGRVTHVLAERVAVMEHREGFAANLVTAVLVTTGTLYGLPVSTTHVSLGGIFGAGAARGALDRKVLRDILLAWVATAPVAAAIAIATCMLMASMEGS